MADGRDGTPHVLIFSHERCLRTTRQRLLEKFGCSVVSAARSSEFRTCLMSGTFDLVILCQSLAGNECESAASFASDHAAGSRVLVMFTRIGKCIPEPADVLLDARAGPRVFLETVQRMLPSAI